MQRIRAYRDGRLESLELPAPQSKVLNEVLWGDAARFGTPAYWKTQLWLDEKTYEAKALGENLREEIAVCMLCGFGMPSELGLLAFQRLRDAGLLSDPGEEDIQKALRAPFTLYGGERRYRFPKQKAKSLNAALRGFDENWATLKPLELRDVLMSLPGIGPKTASWIVRNRTGSDDVAILDVHIARTCIAMNLFETFVASRYPYYEDLFVRFARSLGVRASALDNAIWRQARLVPADVLTA